MDIKDITGSYNEIIDKEKKKYSELSNSIFRVGTLRLIIVLIGIFLSYLLWSNTAWVVVTIVASIVIFAALAVFHNKLFIRRLYSEVKIKNAENELKGLDYDFSAFDGAPEKIDVDHSFSYDLDIFGNRSFFQSLNRTVTSFGKNRLSYSILFPADRKDDIIRNQEAIKELSSKFRFLTHFLAIGSMYETDNLNLNDFTDEFSKSGYFYKKKIWAVLLYAIPLIFFVLFILCLLGLISWNFILYSWIITLLLSSSFMKQTNYSIFLIKRHRHSIHILNYSSLSKKKI